MAELTEMVLTSFVLIHGADARILSGVGRTAVPGSWSEINGNGPKRGRTAANTA